MPKHSHSLAHLTNEELIEEVKTLAGQERVATVQLIASLGELDVRRLYLGEGFPSLFTYCTQCLHLSEHAAYSRIEVARAARRWPVVLDMLASGSLTLTTVVLVGRHLTPENHLTVLEAAKHRSRREIEQQVAALRPLPLVPPSIRKLPAPAPDVQRAPAAPSAPQISVAPTAPTPAHVELARSAGPFVHRALVSPLAPERFKVQITISRETHDRLRRVQDLLRHSVPSGDPAEIFDRGLTLLEADLEKKKLAHTDRPRPAAKAAADSRHVPAAARRAVWKRDEGRCAFVGTTGRCAERGFLEFHHVVPFAQGGETTTANLQLRCRAHNLYEARNVGLGFLREHQIVYGSARSGRSLRSALAAEHAEAAVRRSHGPQR